MILFQLIRHTHSQAEEGTECVVFLAEKESERLQGRQALLGRQLDLGLRAENVVVRLRQSTLRVQFLQ